jgi:hypothetical protein
MQVKKAVLTVAVLGSLLVSLQGCVAVVAGGMVTARWRPPTAAPWAPRPKTRRSP